MSKYTESEPFENENWTAYRNESGQVVASWRAHSPDYMSPQQVEFAHAFIEAERNLDTQAFTPLPVPEVGTWGRFETRKHGVFEGKVRSVTDTSMFAAMNTDDAHGYILTKPSDIEGPDDIIAWTPIDPPVPAEPTGLGAVVTECQAAEGPGLKVAFPDGEGGILHLQDVRAMKAAIEYLDGAR